MAQRQVKVGNISKVSGEVNIATGDIYKGFTAEQVSILITQITSTFQPKKFKGRCPYKGLDVFEEEDADLFFGREKIVDDLVNRVKESRTVFITGPSGSGKSSLVRAGLIYALKQGKIINGEHWLYETIKPGRDPLEALALIFSRLKSPELANYFRQHIDEPNILHECAESALSNRKDQRLVLFIDQFEEVFTQVGKDKAEIFINVLTNAANIDNGREIILFSMRSDFVSNCATYPQLNNLLNKQFVQIGAMQPDELVSAIAQPALRVGLRIDPDLIAQIINDMQGEPGALPLMQFALKDLFEAGQAKGGIIALMLNDYLQRGGIQKSLERHADTAFAKLENNEQEMVRTIFSGLIEIGRGTQDTRRTALFEELIPAHAKAEEVASTVQKLADARLITTDEQLGKDTVTISHEKLIDAWPWLKKLVNENREIIALQNQIIEDAHEWEEQGRDASYLYIGARLAILMEKLKDISLSEKAQTFVKASIDAREASRRKREQTRRLVIIGLSTIALLMGWLAFWGNAKANLANIEKKNAQNQATISQANEVTARSRELAALAEAKIQSQPDIALLLSIEAFALQDNYQTRGSLLDTQQAFPHLRQFLIGHKNWINSVAFSPDGKILASGSKDGSVILWNLVNQQFLDQLFIGQGDSVNSVVFSPDGKILAAGSREGNVFLWDIANGQQIGQPLVDSHPIIFIAFSPDGKTLATGGTNSIITLWNIPDHKRRPPLTGPASGTNCLVFSPDGKTLASGSSDKTITLWNVETREPIGEPFSDQRGAILSVAFSPDGKTLASGSDDGTIILWNIGTQQPIGEPFIGHRDWVNSVAFSPDGNTLVSGGGDKKIIMWNMGTHKPIGETLVGHSGSVTSVTYSADGKFLASGSRDNSIILWDMISYHPIGQVLMGRDPVRGLAFSPDGKLLASGGDDNLITLWDMVKLQSIYKPLIGHSATVTSLAFSPTSNILASGSNDNSAILWNLENTPPTILSRTSYTNWVNSVAFSPDGNTLALGIDDATTLILLSVKDYRPISEPLIGHNVNVASVSFSPDGKILAAGSRDHAISLWDVNSHQFVGQLVGHNDQILSVSFSPDGIMLASGSWDSTIIFWDIHSLKRIGQPITGYHGQILSIAFSPDGKTLALGGDDNSVTLWDVATRQTIGQPLVGHNGPVNIVDFSPDGKTLASGSDDGTVILWNTDLELWRKRNCEIVGRNFSRDEWIQFFPNEEYRATCSQWPLEPETVETHGPTRESEE